METLQKRRPALTFLLIISYTGPWAIVQRPVEESYSLLFNAKSYCYFASLFKPALNVLWNDFLLGGRHRPSPICNDRCAIQCN